MEAAEDRLYRFVAGTYNGLIFGLQKISDVEVQEDAEEEALAGDDSTDTPVQPRSMKTIFAVDAHVPSVKSVAASTTGNMLVSGGTDEIIRIYDVAQLRQFGTLHRHTGSVNCLEFFSTTHLLSGGADGKILVWATGSWSCEATLKGHKGEVTDLSIHPSGRLALSVGRDSTLRGWNLVTGKLAATTRLAQPAHLVKWSPSGDSYAVGCNKQATIFDAKGNITRLINLDTKLLCFVWVKENILATGSDLNGVTNEPGKVQIWDTYTGECLLVLRGHQSRIRGLDVCYRTCAVDETPYLASASTDGAVMMWDIEAALDAAEAAGSDSESGSGLVWPIAQAVSEQRVIALCTLGSRPPEWKAPVSAPVEKKTETVAEKAAKKADKKAEKQASKAEKVKAKVSTKAKTQAQAAPQKAAVTGKKRKASEPESESESDSEQVRTRVHVPFDEDDDSPVPEQNPVPVTMDQEPEPEPAPAKKGRGKAGKASTAKGTSIKGQATQVAKPSQGKGSKKGGSAGAGVADTGRAKVKSSKGRKAAPVAQIPGTVTFDDDHERAAAGKKLDNKRKKKEKQRAAKRPRVIGAAGAHLAYEPRD